MATLSLTKRPTAKKTDREKKIVKLMRLIDSEFEVVRKRLPLAIGEGARIRRAIKEKYPQHYGSRAFNVAMQRITTSDEYIEHSMTSAFRYTLEGEKIEMNDFDDGFKKGYATCLSKLEEETRSLAEKLNKCRRYVANLEKENEALRKAS